MIIFKILWHLNAFVWKIIFKLIYCNKLALGEKVTFRKGFTLLIDKAGKVHIGNGVFFNNYCSVVSMNNIYIGNDCIFGENVKIYDHNHRFNKRNKAIAEQGFKTAPIVIKDNCWIANDVVILKGVTIGENSVIGAGCIVNKDVPANSVLQISNGLNKLSRIEYKV